MPTPTVLLFDIDGTLMTTGGAGRRAMEHAFAATTGRADACTGVAMAGMTDRAIIAQGLTHIGHAPDPDTIDAVLAGYLQALPQSLAEAQGLLVLPGVLAVLDGLAHATHVAVGLGTGNVRPGAALKLGRVDLWTRFAFGGFGCDATLRPALIAKGASQGAAQLGKPLSDCRVVVIGDTLHDISAAHANHFACLAVATGGTPAAVLAAARPAGLVEALDDPHVLPFLLG
jgi:phosphoglycolate phosphatase